MHILIALATAIGGMLWALYRLQQSGVNLNDFNPFYWMRRRQWQKKVGAKPLHGLDSPMDAAACLLVGIATLDGEISREQKNDIMCIFEQEFSLDSEAAKDLFSGSAYLLRDTVDVSLEVNHILQPVKEKFTAETRASLTELLQRVAGLDHTISIRQQQLIDKVTAALAKNVNSQWQ